MKTVIDSMNLIRNNNSGIFIVIEGPNGSGKTTISKEIEKILKSNGFDVYLTKEPTSSEIGKLSRVWENHTSHPEVLACLVAADRYNHISEIILPALQSGKIVISDRYLPSSLVLQRIDGLDLEFIFGLNSHIIIPNLIIILECTSNTLISRLGERTSLSRFEKLGVVGINQEIQYYNELIPILENKGFQISLVNNEREIKDVITDIEEITKKYLNKSS